MRRRPLSAVTPHAGGADSKMGHGGHWRGTVRQGLRELPKHTPDGLPILDRVPPFANLFVATGHSMLGITLAPGSGQAMADFVLSGRRPALLEPFRVQRCAGH